MIDFLVDAILILVVFFGFVLGWKRGFIGIVARPVKLAASIAIAFGFSRAFSESVVIPMIEEPASEYVRGFLYNNCSHITAQNAVEELPTVLRIAAALFDIDISEVASGASGAVIDAIADKLTHPVVQTASLVISFVLLLIIASLGLAILISIIKSLFNKGVLGAFNKFLGVLFGVAFFLLLAWGLAVLLDFLVHRPSFADYEWVKSFDGGIIYKFFNEYNPIELLLSF